MKTHSIILHPLEARAAAQGRLSRIWRPMTLQPKIVHAVHPDGSIVTERIFRRGDQRIHCPYGAPGDVLVGRETWFEVYDPHSMEPTGAYCYAATHNGDVIQMDDDGFPAFNKDGSSKSPWRSASQMPLQAARSKFEIVSVGVRQVQAIKWWEAIACGMRDPRRCKIRIDNHNPKSPVNQFVRNWDARYAARGLGWAANPWAWALVVRATE